MCLYGVAERVIRYRLTCAFGHDPAAVLGVDYPVVVLQRVHDLENSADSADGVVDGHCADELSRQVCVQGQLHLEKTKRKPS